MWIPSFPTLFVKKKRQKLSFHYWMVLIPLLKIIWPSIHLCEIYFWGLYSVSLVYISFFMQGSLFCYLFAYFKYITEENSYIICPRCLVSAWALICFMHLSASLKTRSVKWSSCGEDKTLRGQMEQRSLLGLRLGTVTLPFLSHCAV